MTDIDTSELPKTLSGLIKLALHDVELCERNPEFKVDMSAWNRQKNDGFCHVCFAGAVMVQTLGLPKGFGASFVEDVEISIIPEMKALDLAQNGYLVSAIHLIHGEIASVEDPQAYDYIKYCSYVENPERFKSNMQKIATQLEEDGL